MSYLKINSFKERGQIVANYQRKCNFSKEKSGFETQRQCNLQEPYKSSQKEKRNTLFGVQSKGDGLYIGKSPITITEGEEINDNLITIDGINYNLAPGLIELITKFNPDKEVYDKEDLENYKKIIIQTKAIYSDSKPNKPKSSKSSKYREIIAPIWKEIKTNKRPQVIILPSDPNALTEMLYLRVEALRAGNTGVRNEAVAICVEILRQGVLDSEKYKAIQNLFLV